MPFKEPGTEELLAASRLDRLELSERVVDAARAEHIVITLGTPSLLAHRDRHARHPLGARRAAAGTCAPATRWSCARRSRPGTTEFVAGYLEKQRGFAVGEDVFVAHVPERIAAGRFLEEIATLPCIVGGVGEASGEHGRALFEVFGAPIVQTTPVQAELAKIWTNILRYTKFALPNLLMMDCERTARTSSR